MSPEPPSPAPDLLVIGALTVDRFADGSSAPGGSVLHIARAAAHRGVQVGVITVAGLEAAAQAGMSELRSLGCLVKATAHSATWTFRHVESAAGRRLWLERAGGPVLVSGDLAASFGAAAILFAPVASELDPGVLDLWNHGARSGAILQGWLRAADDGSEVGPVALADLADSLRPALSRMSVLFASREDLAAVAKSPPDQVARLREWVGRGPALVVTDGPRGLWLDVTRTSPAGDSRSHLPARHVVDDVSTVGAGDMLAAFLTTRLGQNRALTTADAQWAMDAVAEELAARRRT